MMKVLAPVDNIRFDIEEALEKQSFAVPLPFSGMDKSAVAVCELFVRSMCPKGNLCPFRHVKGDKSVVCKHWLRGLCKKGDECEFLHEYDMSKMPECFFYSKYGQCGNKECEFLHLDRESKIKDCPWYDRGFCRHGPNCKNRHVKKVICQNYLFGFCPEGPSCKFKHPKFDLPVTDQSTQQKKQIFICDFCGEKGHKITSCFKLNPEFRQVYQQTKFAMASNFEQKQQLGNHDMNSSMGSLGNMSMNGQDGGSGGEAKDDEMRADGEARRNDENNKPNEQASGDSSFGGSGGQSTNPAAGGQFGGGRPNNGSFGGPNFHHRFNNHFGHHHNHFNHHNAHGPGDKFPSQPKPPSEVTCFKCGEKGHYANRCNKSVYAFLRSNNE